MGWKVLGAMLPSRSLGVEKAIFARRCAGLAKVSSVCKSARFSVSEQTCQKLVPRLQFSRIKRRRSIWTELTAHLARGEMALISV
jgi:hypothetical protein